MKVSRELTERLQALLGGKNPTNRRIEALLDEIQELKKSPTAVATLERPGGPDPDPEPIEKEDDKPLDPDGDDGARGAALAPQATFQDPEKALLWATIRNLEQTIQEIRKPPTAEEKGEAMFTGKLPVSTIPGPPLGYTGTASLPRGVWFESPFGPKIHMKLCGCAQCGTVMHHYFCVSCRSGPHNYQQRHPGGRKAYFAPGSTWGVSHEACSPVCWMRYLEGPVGVVMGVNDAEPPVVAGAEPVRPVVGVGSD